MNFLRHNDIVVILVLKTFCSKKKKKGYQVFCLGTDTLLTKSNSKKPSERVGTQATSWHDIVDKKIARSTSALF